MKQLAGICLLALACGQAPALPQAETDFVTDDPTLADEVRGAAAAWAAAGLTVADYVTVNQVEHGGVVVALRPRAALPGLCNATGPAREGGTLRKPEGCASHRAGRFVGLWLALETSPARRATIIAHEMVHILVPSAEHLDQKAGAHGILTSNGNASEPTPEDMAELARHTEVELP